MVDKRRTNLYASPADMNGDSRDQSTNGLPAGWMWTGLGSILDFKGGSQPPKSTFIYVPNKGYIRLLQIRDFGDNEVSTFIKKVFASKICVSEDVLIARYGASLGSTLTGMSGIYNVAMSTELLFTVATHRQAQEHFSF
jgi:hypothetical protein